MLALNYLLYWNEIKSVALAIANILIANNVRARLTVRATFFVFLAEVGIFTDKAIYTKGINVIIS